MSTETPYVQDEFFESLLTDFLDESSQLLDSLNEDLLVLDDWVTTLDEGNNQRCDDELMNSMFRAAHSFKGLSAMLGLENVNHLTHKIENVFDAARKDELSFNSDNVQVIFRSVDLLVAMVGQLRDSGSDYIDADEVILEIQGVLQAVGDAPCEQFPPNDMNTISPNNDDSALQEADAGQLEETITIDYFEQIVDETEVPPKYLAIFIDETEEAIDSLTETLLHIEAEEGNSSTQTLLVTSHRIKGSAASVGLNRPAKLSHLMEDILQELRESGDTLTVSLTDAMLKCTDALRHYIVGLKSGSPESETFNEMALGLMAAWKVECGESSSSQEGNAKSDAESVGEPKQSTQVLALESDEALLSSLREMAEGIPTTIVGRVYFEDKLPMSGLKGRLVYEKLSNLGEVFYCDPPVASVEEIENLDTFTFGLGCDQALEAVRGKLQIAGIDRIELQYLTCQAEEESSASPKQTQPQKKSHDQPKQETPPVSTKAQPTEKPQEAKQPAAVKSRNAEKGSRPNETLRVDIDRLDQLMNLAGQLVINKARFTQIGEGLQQAMLSKQTPQLIFNAGSLIEKIVSGTRVNDGKRISSSELEAVCSNARRLQADLETVSREINRLTEIRSGVGNLFEAVHQLDRVAEGIQQSVMDTRMVPIGPLFGRFKRVIRDITRTNDKDIQLVIRGEKTELDKRMIDELGDPLIHMVRNSADHGIESPEEREAAGKPRQGVVTLDAFHRGNSIVIQVKDDGKGLSHEKILDKALEKNLATRTDLERMTPHQVYQMIWEPGFSTAEKVTEISGRGMGMDIVRSKIDELNGTCDVDSELGVGTTFTIKLPLTLAIMPSLLAEIEGDVFALPVESVVEIVSIPDDQMSTVHGMTTATIRGRVVSVVDLNEVFTWNSPPLELSDRHNAECTLVVIGQEGEEVGLKVHSLLGEEDIVIKSLAENYQNVHGVAGASILGDGRVSLILDVPALIEMSSHGAEAEAHV